MSNTYKSERQHVFRVYSYDEIQKNIKKHYQKMRTLQTYDHVCKMHQNFTKRNKTPIKIMDAIEMLDGFIDVSDPDISMPNIHHLFQTAEGLRKAGEPDWLQLVGLIHDLGKLAYQQNKPEFGLSNEEQWSIVGDTFLVGCQIPYSCVYPEFNKQNTDMSNPHYNTKIGIYQPNCGLNNCLCAWGHDEILYKILKETPNNLPKEALYIVRYHSLYPYHTGEAYKELTNDNDKMNLQLIKKFNQFDLYTKENMEANINELKEYYQRIIDKYFPEGDILNF
jgi:inositol oxygenase